MSKPVTQIALVLAIFGLTFALVAFGTNLATISNTAFAQGNFMNVDIVQKAASLADKAFSPNPIEVSIGTTVIWTNQDAEAHTVTSGDVVTGTVLFGSPELSRGMQFNHTFNQAGNFTYYCSIHPTMVGIVSVTDAEMAPPAIKLTVQIDKPEYHVSETVIISGSAPAGQPIKIKTVNPSGNLYSVDEVTASSTGSYNYPITIEGPLASNGTYQVIVTTPDRQLAETHFKIENYASQDPKISIILVNTYSPRFDIDTLEISGAVTVLCLESTSAPECPPQIGTIFWGDGKNSTFDANTSSKWGPIQHVFATAGSIHVSLVLSEKDSRDSILAQDGLVVTVMKHKTLLSTPKLSDYTAIEGKTFQALQAVLTDIDLQKPIGGKTITFSGPALAESVSALGMDNGDFVFPVELKASNNVGNMTLHASFAGDNQYELTDSAKVHVLIAAAPALPTTPVNSTTTTPASPVPPKVPIQDCASGNLQCLDPATLVIIICLVVAGGAVGTFKIFKRASTSDNSKNDKNADKQMPKPNVSVRSGEIRGYIELDGEKFEKGGL